MENLLERAQQMVQQQKLEDAATIYQHLLFQEPENLKALMGLSAVNLQLGRHFEAIDLLSKALKLSPENAELYSQRGVAYFLSARIEEALEDLNKAQKLEPENPYRYSSRAFVRDKAGDLKGAISDYQKAIELDPEDAIAHNNLGLIQEKMGYKEQAKENFTKADTLQGRPPMPEIGKTEKTESTDAETPKPELSLRHFLATSRSVFTSREGFKEFINFLFRNKNRD